MFASGVIVPVEGMPLWEQYFAKSFPMYYAADMFKGVMLSTPAEYLRDVLVLLAFSAGGLTFATIMLRRRQAAL